MGNGIISVLSINRKVDIPMSKETIAWLNQNVLVGFTDKRGNAWHYKASEQGAEPNHYPQAIPVDDVLRRLFQWNAVELPVLVNVPCGMDDATGMDANGNPFRTVVLEDRKAIARDDTFDVFGLFKSGYSAHQYRQWLVENVSTILDDSLSIGSAGLLRKGAQAFVSVEVPENVETPEGVTFRPNLLACTSLDGTLATTYKRVVTLVVCDNTLSAGLSERGETFKVKHTKYSGMRIADAREALSIVYQTADDFMAEVAKLCSITVSEAQWNKVLEAMVPMDVDSKRSVTVASDKRSRLASLYKHDNRVAPWAGTAFGVLQAFNTFNHHFTATRGETVRAERNMSDALTGKLADADSEVLAILATV